TWAALYGGSGSEEMEGVRQTSDGGFIVVGSTDSYGDPNGDAWVVKLDRYGAVDWAKTYGGGGDEYLVDVRETAGGGYIAVGWTKSFGAGKMDAWVVKLTASGNVEWASSYGGSGNDQAWSVDLTSDGAYLVGGGTTSFGAGRADYWVLKLDSAGNILWQNTYGGPRNDGGGGDYAEYVVRAFEDADGNYVVASESFSFGAGASDIWVLKLGPNGDILWQKAYGGLDEDTMWSLTEAAGGGYIVPGNTVSFSPDWSGDTWVLKLDTAGNVEWEKVLGIAHKWDEALSVGAASDGGALVGSYVEQGSSDWDLLLIRLDVSGNVVWKKYYEHSWDWPNAIEETPDGGFVVAAVAWPPPGNEDLLVLRVDQAGDIGQTCSLVHDLTLSEVPTAATVTPTNAVAQPSSAAAMAANVVVADTTAAPSFLCQGQPAEDCGNGVDDDGDGFTDCADPDCLADDDGDGYVVAPCGSDCDDQDPAVHPGVPEVCGNGTDDECDGLADCDDPDCQAQIDTDGDGYLGGTCGSDCNDTDPAVHPGATEVCDNAQDDDCDGLADCNDAACIETAVCALPADYARGRSKVRFRLGRTDRDSLTAKVCVDQGLCDALAAMSGNPGASMTLEFDACPPVVVSGDTLASNGSATVFKAKAAAHAAPRHVVKVNCRKLKAVFKLRSATLQGCIADPVAVTVAATSARQLHAEASFTELRNGRGELTGLSYLSPVDCTP
ncbi:MAG: hypothetical protein D6815_07295, partial [Candidatus Dadabacteria bacterium]